MYLNVMLDLYCVMTIIEHFLLMVFSITCNNILVYIVVGISYWWMKRITQRKERDLPKATYNNISVYIVVGISCWWMKRSTQRKEREEIDFPKVNDTIFLDINVSITPHPERESNSQRYWWYNLMA